MAKIRFLPVGKTIKTRSGQTVIHAAKANRVVIPQRCGGHASCLMCKVIVEEGRLGPPTALERRKLSEYDLNRGVRLACQAKTTDQDCTLRIPENKLKSVVQAALERQRAEEDDL
jgi:2Fe-2S ferredoxin